MITSAWTCVNRNVALILMPRNQKWRKIMEFFSSISSLKTDDHLENFYIIRFYKRFDFYHVLNNKRANKAY